MALLVGPAFVWFGIARRFRRNKSELATDSRYLSATPLRPSPTSPAMPQAIPVHLAAHRVPGDASDTLRS